MNRHEQRKQKFLQDPEVADGYRAMAAEFQSIQRIHTKKCTSEEASVTKVKKRCNGAC